MSDFFAPAPAPPATARASGELRARIVTHGPPRGVLPAVVPAERVLGRTADAVVSLSRLWVYPTGFALQLLVDLEDEWSELDPFQTRASWRGEEVPATSPALLNFGFAFADGSKATTVIPGPHPPAEDGSRTPSLTGMGGSGGGGQFRRSLWLAPLPPEGPIGVACEWRAAGLELTRHELDGEAITAAAGRAQTVFERDEESGW